jgi:hypothetical protein
LGKSPSSSSRSKDLANFILISATKMTYHYAASAASSNLMCAFARAGGAEKVSPNFNAQ